MSTICTGVGHTSIFKSWLDGNDNPVVIRENVDIEVTFAVRRKYANSAIDVMSVHNAFVSYMTGSDVWIKSS